MVRVLDQRVVDRYAEAYETIGATNGRLVAMRSSRRQTDPALCDPPTPPHGPQRLARLCGGTPPAERGCRRAFDCRFRIRERTRRCRLPAAGAVRFEQLHVRGDDGLREMRVVVKALHQLLLKVVSVDGHFPC